MPPSATYTNGDSSNGPPHATYGFIGIGVMGYGMAANLRAKIPKSSKLIICEINEARREQFFAENKGLLEVARSPREVAEQADIIITMLPKGEHVFEVFTNPSDGLLSVPNNNSEKLFLECSTIETSTSMQIGDLVRESGLGLFVGAPVSGGPKFSNLGQLTFMVGGSAEEFATVKPILSMMGKEEGIFHCGSAGAGLATKQLNNYLAFVSFIGLCEVMNTGISFGLDPKVLAGVINASSGMCWNSLHENPVKGVIPTASSARDFKGGFTTELCKGVNEMAIALTKQVGAKSLLSPVVQKVLDTAAESPKCKGQECRSVYRLFAEDGGQDLD